MASNIKQSKIKQLIQIFLKDKERKPLFKIVRELIQLFTMHRRNPIYYFSRRLFKKDRTNIKDFIPDKLLWSLWDKFNDLEAANILKNKLLFDLFYGQFNIALPKILMYNHLKVFVRDHIRLEINAAHDFELMLEDLINNHTSYKSVFIKKTYGSYGGSCTYKISADLLPLNHSSASNIYMDICRSGYLFQETIQQHSQMDTLNPSCLNTIRFDTFIDRDGNADIISAFLRMSSNNLHVDNCSSGGCFVGINLDSGKLKKYGYTSFTKAGGKILTEHPISKITFEDFCIPNFQEAKELVLKVAGFLPNLRLIGWDIGIGISGPVLIEGNCGYDISVSDLAYGGYRNNPVFKKLLDEINYSIR
jgi:hypothetical protein